MGETLSKIETFIFDILGLVLPGIIFLSVLILPIYIIDLQTIPKDSIDNSFILSELSIIHNLAKIYWDENSNLLLTSILILSYLVGHFVKVFSIIKYEILVAIFDKTINKLIKWIFEFLENCCNWLYQKILKMPLNTTYGYELLKEIFKPIKNTISKIFVFKPEDYFSDNDTLRTNCVNLINSRLSTNYPDKWYSLYKFSAVITAQENIKSLSAFFLAKYNLYRSLAFIFLFATFYYNIFFIASINYLPTDFKKLSSLILLTSILLWFTFHYKYKRYWTLCGNETLVSLFYFLNKKKINES